ncbi:deaminase [Spiroplasma corruscae]|nr:deaminase [Spiroplasma corruscae]
MQINKIYNLLNKSIEKCKKSKDVPVVSLLYKDEYNFYLGFNTRQKKYEINNHAEINCINKAFKKTRSKNMSEYKLYVNLKPCLMCITTLEQVNIKEVYYWLENDKIDYSRIRSSIIFSKVYNKRQEEFFRNELQNFFKILRG